MRKSWVIHYLFIFCLKSFQTFLLSWVGHWLLFSLIHLQTNTCSWLFFREKLFFHHQYDSWGASWEHGTSQHDVECVLHKLDMWTEQIQHSSEPRPERCIFHTHLKFWSSKTILGLRCYLAPYIPNFYQKNTKLVLQNSPFIWARSVEVGKL